MKVQRKHIEALCFLADAGPIHTRKADQALSRGRVDALLGRGLVRLSFDAVSFRFRVNLTDRGREIVAEERARASAREITRRPSVIVASGNRPDPVVAAIVAMAGEEWLEGIR